MSALLKTLSAAHERLAEHEREHRARTESTARGRQQLAAAHAERGRLGSEDDAAVTRQVKRLTEHARAGKSGPLPQIAPSDKHLVEQLAAQRRVEAATQAVTILEAEERESAAAVRAAREAVQQAALAVIAEEAEGEARELEELRAVVASKELHLRGLLALPGFVSPPRVLTALCDDLNTPISALRARSDLDVPVAELAGHVMRSSAATAAWQARLAELVSAPELPEPTERAA